MKIKLILAILFCGIVSVTSCKAVKSAFGFGESTEQVQPAPQESKSVPFEPTEEDVERGKSLFTILIIAVSIFGVVFLGRLLYLHKKKE